MSGSERHVGLGASQLLMYGPTKLYMRSLASAHSPHPQRISRPLSACTVRIFHHAQGTRSLDPAHASLPRRRRSGADAGSGAEERASACAAPRRRSPALAFRCSIRRRSSASSASRARRPVPAVRHQPVQPRTCGLSCSASRAAPRCLRLPSRLRPVPAQPRLRHGRVAVVYAPAPPAPIVVYPGRRAGSNEGDSDHGQMRGTRITVK